MGFGVYALAAKPGGVLLFHRLGDSTIGAVRFHGRVRDGIGWFTDAMATRLWSQRAGRSASSPYRPAKRDWLRAGAHVRASTLKLRCSPITLIGSV